MSKERISTSAAPEVIIEQIGGNLQVKGWDEPAVVIQADPGALHVQEQDDVVRLSCDGDCDLRLPSGASVQVEVVHGEARFRILDDSLKIETVHGGLFLRNVADTQVETVHGELIARQVSGDLLVAAVHGNALLRDIQGRCILEEALGNIDLRDVDGDLRLTLEGNARLRLSSLAGSQYDLRAEGNVHCRLPEDANLRLNLQSEAEYISLKLADGSKLYQQQACETVLGSGATPMNISAGGSIYLSVYSGGSDDEERAAEFTRSGGVPPDFSEQIARQVEAQIEAQMEMMNRNLELQMANLTASINRNNLTAEERERILRRAQERNERAAAQAQEKMRRAQEKIERKLEANRKRGEPGPAPFFGFRHGRGGLSVNIPPQPPAPPSQPVDEEERLMILRMLEQKKITLDEAEQLLSALEGKES